MATTSTRFSNQLQSLFPGEIVTLIEVDGARFGARTYRFHGENIQFTAEEILESQTNGTPLPVKNITFRGETYGPRPFGIGAINLTSDGKASKIELTVSNVDQAISALIRTYNGLVQARVTIWITLRSNINPDGSIADGDFRRLVYYIERPKAVDYQTASFELTSPMDMDGIMIPARQVQTVCYWAQKGLYRSGNGCGYNGTRYFNKDNEPVSDPSLDYCIGNVQACRLRFGANQELDFGGCATATIGNSNR
jgi:lambda family phage minor tail protein L